MTGTRTARRVLIFHREPQVAADLRRTLAAEGYEVACADSSSEARAAQRAFAPDLLLIDSTLADPYPLESGDSHVLTPGVIRVGDLILDDAAHQVRRAGAIVELTGTEFRLLRCLMTEPERVWTRRQLLETVWDYDFGGDARVLETYVCYLRRKLEPHGDRLIHTVRGVGYVLRPS